MLACLALQLPMWAPMGAASAQEAALLATPAVEIGIVTGELLGQASACRVAAPRIKTLETRIKAALQRAAANKKDLDYALERFEEERKSGADRQRRRLTGINCAVVTKSLAELERRRF